MPAKISHVKISQFNAIKIQMIAISNYYDHFQIKDCAKKKNFKKVPELFEIFYGLFWLDYFTLSPIGPTDVRFAMKY